MFKRGGSGERAGSVKEQVINALRIAAKGEMADITKPMKGLGAGVYEITISYRKNAL